MISYCSEKTSITDEDKEDPGANVIDRVYNVHFTLVIDEAGLVSVRLTLDESTNMGTDRTQMMDTLEDMYDPDDIIIHENTSEEFKKSNLNEGYCE